MLALPDVTLCCIDTANHRLALRALEKSVSGIRFARARLVTDVLPEGLEVPPGIEVVEGLSIRSRDDYSQIVLKSLLPHCATSHILLIQWDGYVVHPEAWTPEFLDCDYLGAKWFWHDDGMTVGNGGFSLRSRRLLEALQDPRIVLEGNEDETICRHFRPLLEREHRIRFGDEALADRFSFEGSYPVGKPFGFHALFNFWRVMPADEIAAMVPAFSDAIAGSPQFAQLMRNCAAMGLWTAAAAIATRILATQPGEPEAATVLEQARAQAGRPPNVGRNDPCPCGSGRKFKHCHGSLDGQSSTASEPPPPAAAPKTVEARISLALSAHQRGDLATAEQGYRSVLSAVREHPLAMHFLGVILYQRGEVAAALPLLERSAALVPQEPEFHNNLGLAFAALDRHDDAIAAFRRSLGHKPDHAVAWNNLGLSLQASGRVEEAVEAYREAIAKAPQFGHAHWNLAVALLTLGAFAEGWREYEWRLALAELGRREARRPGPPWHGRIEAGRRILLTSEQGIGDAVQFIRFARPLAARGMHVIVEVPAVLRTLAVTAPGVAAAFAPGDALPAYDYRVPLLSVAGPLGVDAGGIPSDVPYLRPEPARRARAREALQSHPGRLKVGLCWAGNPAHANDRRRSLPLDALAPLFAREELRFFSLQKDSRAGTPVIELPLRNDFDDLAALVAEVDLVISVDTAVAHLAGALARPTWVLLPYAPDWRWGLGRTDSAWYPSVRLFRQPAIGDWAAVIRAVDAALESRDRSCVS